jgi:hypothetical protein
MAQPGPWLVRTDAPGWKIELSWADQKPDDAVYFSQRANDVAHQLHLSRDAADTASC